MAKSQAHTVIEVGPDGSIKLRDLALLMGLTYRSVYQWTRDETGPLRVVPSENPGAKGEAARVLTRRTTVSDFRPQDVISAGSFPDLKPWAEGAEVEYGTLVSEGQTFRIGKFGRAIGLSFEAMINDDLRILDTAIRGAASKAFKLETSLVYGALLGNGKLSDGKSVFNATRGNLIGAALTVEGLSAARTALRIVKDADGEAMNLAPAILLVGPEMETAALQLVAPITAITATGVNPFAGSNLKIVVDPAIVGDDWYLLASPDHGDAVELAYLDGYEGVQVEEVQHPLIDGVSFVAKAYVGAALTGWRGLIKSNGADGQPG